MLLEFSVENFMSFKERATISLVPSRDKEHPENIIIQDKGKALNTILMYGANASGKTSIFKAMTVAIVMVRTSNNRQVNEILPVEPFAFSDESVNSPSKFEFRFIANDGIKYVYGFSADRHSIHEEYLLKYSSRRPTKIFERNGNEFDFTARESGILDKLVQMNTDNKLFLATATMWNAQSTKAAFEWLNSGIDTYTDLMNLTQASLAAYQGDNAEDYISFTEKLLKEADINISKLDVNVKKAQIDPKLLPFVPGIVINGQLIQPKEQNLLEIFATHDILDEDGNLKKKIKLTIGSESQGTQLMISFGPMLRDTLINGKTLVIDELDRSLHTSLVKYLINLFRNPDINKSGAQLIVTTHDTSVMTLEMFRREQIYLTEKNNDNGESHVYSLDQFPVRKTENIQKGYLLGRYGAIPFPKAGDII